jgi:hypothetical protein
MARQVATNAELAELRERGRGFIYQDWTIRGADTSGNRLHWVGCDQVARMLQGADPSRRPSVPKIFFDDLDDALAWLLANRGAESERWRRCSRCDAEGPGTGAEADPALVAASARPTQPVPVDETAPAFREADVEEALYRHLEAGGYRVERGVRVPSGIVDAVATSSAERVVIEAKGEDRGGYGSAQMNFQIGIGQLASRMVDEASVYALAFPDSEHYRAVLRTFGGSIAFVRLNLRFYAVGRDGSVRTIEADEISAWIDALS